MEYFFYRWIPAQGKWNLIKFINLFYLINPIEFYKTYRNIAIGNYLINCRELFKYYSVFGIALCNSLILFKSGKKVERRYFGLEIWLSAKKEAVLGFSQRIVCNLSSTGLEMYKILIIQKGSIVLICFVLYLSATIEQYDVYYSPLTRYMNQFYECFETASEQEVDAFILALENSLEEIEIDYQKALENYQKGKINADDMDNAQYAYEAHRVERDALPQIQEEWFEINQLRSKGINARLVNPIGYEHLWGVTAWGFQRELGLSVLLILIVLLSGVFSDERQGGYHYLLFSLPLGREELFRKKRRAVFYLVCIIWILASGVEYTHIRINYFLPAWSSPVQSLPFFRDFPFSIPIISFYVMWNSMRFILIFAISGFIGMISSSLEWAKSILVNSICFLLPSAFYVLGFTALQFVTLILPFNASELLGRGASYGQVLLWDGILIVLGSAGWCYTKKNCCKVRQR